MIPTLNPRQMERLMKQMGIKNENISAKRVVIETDSGKLIIENPQVMKVMMAGNESFQISGEVREEKEENNDVKIIMEKTGKSREEAEKALEECGGDIAEAILRLSS
ncbi:nascent polypeptide-associated complex protein [Candidatus Micrarchaeota archaeon]|nr:MAG: nascent polypeptide-associated complex protein [Candidatus Micrarchaeota archaeon]